MEAVGGRYPFDTEVTFSCNGGYTRNGCYKTTCTTSGQWDHNIPTCDKGNKLSNYFPPYMTS